jgi:hypothetical protein
MVCPGCVGSLRVLRTRRYSVALGFFVGLGMTVRSAGLPRFRRSWKKVRSWFDRLTTNGTAQCKFNYLPLVLSVSKGDGLFFHDRTICGLWLTSALITLKVICLLQYQAF